jgi:hypothetical protein
VLQGEFQGECGVCRKAITAEFPGVVVCTRCRALYHPDCWEFNGDKCGVYGCAPASKRSPAAIFSAPAVPPASTMCTHHSGVPARVFCQSCNVPLCGECAWAPANPTADARRYCDGCVPRRCLVCTGTDHFVKDCGCLWLILIGGAIAAIFFAFRALFGK